MFGDFGKGKVGMRKKPFSGFDTDICYLALDTMTDFRGERAFNWRVRHSKVFEYVRRRKVPSNAAPDEHERVGKPLRRYRKDPCGVAF